VAGCWIRTAATDGTEEPSVVGYGSPVLASQSVIALSQDPDAIS
jgi:hypothetical protein